MKLVMLTIILFQSFGIYFSDNYKKLNENYIYVEEAYNSNVIYGSEFIGPNIEDIIFEGKFIIVEQNIVSKNNYFNYLSDYIYVNEFNISREESIQKTKELIELEPHKTALINKINFWAINLKTNKVYGPYDTNPFQKNKS